MLFNFSLTSTGYPEKWRAVKICPIFTRGEMIQVETAKALFDLLNSLWKNYPFAHFAIS